MKRNHNTLKYLRTLVASGLMIGLLNGCVGYRLGSMLPNDIRTVHIPTFVNKTDEPFLAALTTQAAIREFQNDGSLKVAPLEDADSVLEVTIREYSISPLRYDVSKATQANEYRIHLTAHVTLIRTDTDEAIMQDPSVRGEATFEVIGDLSTSKRVGLPDAAEDLAHDIVERVVEYW